MSTPCILGLGGRASWKGVPCKMDGGEESTGPVLIDCVVRSGGVGAAAKALVVDSPFGWTWAGGERLTEEDEFLVGSGLSETTSRLTLNNHYALFLLDPDRSCLEVKILPEDRWLDPVLFERDGAVAELPAWYPQPNLEAEIERPPMPTEVKKRLQDFCEKNRIRKSVLMDALRQWCTAALGDLSGSTWILNEGSADAAYVGGRVDEVMVYAATDAHGTTFKSSDGKLRRFDVHDVRLAGKIFARLPQLPRYSGTLGSTGLPQPGHASEVIEMLLSAAYEVGSGVPRARASWTRGTESWDFATPGAGGIYEKDPFPSGWLPLFLSWLLAT